ncbi:MAG: AtpZ/AtpI family protein [Bacteroidales bacterium]|jgi:F0F1-type ATP synthase assembly protein I|nr:AtpZ/AtpI family protein [Bacteroidales bacterium]
MNNKNDRPLKGYAHYSGISVQMIVIIGGFAFGGVKLDEYLNLKPLFTLLLSLAGIALAMYYVIKDLIRKK